jgi:hypothetical protein
VDGAIGGRRRRALLWLVLVLVLVWMAVSALSVGQVALDLRDARTSLVEAESDLRASDFSSAREEFESAAQLADRSSSRLDAGYLQPWRALPVVSENLEAVSALSDATRDVGRAARDLLGVVTTVVSDDRGTDGGGIPIDYLRTLAPPTRHLADQLASSTEQVVGSGHPRLVGAVADARASYLDVATPAVEQVGIGADLTEVMPTFLGDDGPRTYLVGAAALSELRGSGGLLGSYSILTADEGRLDFTDFGDIEDLERDVASPDVAAPSDEYDERYRRLGGLRFWRNANLSTDFPWSAEVLLALWEADDRPPLDGVIVADPITFQRIVERSGAIEVPGVTTLTPDNVLDFVGLEAYAAFEDHVERKQVLGAVATAAFARAFALIEGDDLPAAIDVVSALTRGGNLRVYSRVPEVQAALARAGVAGEIGDDAGEFGAVVVNNVAANKVDVFTDRTIEHHVELLAEGVTAASVSAAFANRAPTEGVPRYVIGPWTESIEAGDNLSAVTFLCGIGCDVVGGPDNATSRGSERGHPATDVRVHVPAGEAREVTFDTRTRGGWEDTDGVAELVVRHRSQPVIAATELRIVVSVPEGFTVTDMPEDAEVRDDEVVWSTDEPPSTLELLYRFAPS